MIKKEAGERLLPLVFKATGIKVLDITGRNEDRAEAMFRQLLKN
jgi:hypothetical protein